MVCEKCWADAALLARSECTSQTEAYYKILARHNHDSTTRIRELEAQLAKIAHIAHNNGLDNLTEAEALGRICILSLAWRDRKEE